MTPSAKAIQDEQREKERTEQINTILTAVQSLTEQVKGLVAQVETVVQQNAQSAELAAKVDALAAQLQELPKGKGKTQMPLTRVQVERMLVKRLGTLLTSAELSTAIDGSNEDLNDGIGYAVRQLGGLVADITAVADSDLAAFVEADYDRLLDLAELRTLETIVNHLDDVNIKAGPLATNYSEFADRALKALEKKRQAVKDAYGVGGAQLEAGNITLDIARKNSDLLS